jgi:peptide/nickel transport system substrate-binding protein
MDTARSERLVSRRQFLRAAFIGGTAALAAASAASAAQTSAAAAGVAEYAIQRSAAQGGPSDLVIAMSGEPGTLDTQQGFSALEGTLGHNLFDSMVGEAPDSSLIPGLALSWDFAPDFMSVNMHLRPNVTFHDGTPFNADAVKFNYERQLDPNNDYNKIGTWKLQPQFAGNIVVPIEVIDDQTVKISFKQKLPPDLSLAYMITAPHEMESPTAIQSAREQYADHPVGTGPYKFASWDRGQRIVLERNADYWGIMPQYDRVVLVPITDPDARLAALQAGTVDINMDISGDQLTSIRNDPNFSVFQRASAHIWHILLNQKTVPELKDKRVRMALNYAVNKDSIVHDILADQGTVAKGFMSSTYGEWVEPALPGFAYDPDMAKQLLAAAGFPNGNGFPQLAMKIPTDATLAGKPVPMSEAIQSDLAAVGVNITLQPSDFGSWVGQVGKGDFQIAVFSLSISLVDPDNALHGYVKDGEPPSFHNFGFYENDEYESLFAQQRAVTDHAQRLQIVRRMQQIACSEDPAALWIEHATSAIVASSAKVKNITGINDAQMMFNMVEKP